MAQNATRDGPTCVLCGFDPAGLDAGLSTVPEDDVPDELPYPNRFLPETSEPPEGTVWVCNGCKRRNDDGDLVAVVREYDA